MCREFKIQFYKKNLEWAKCSICKDFPNVLNRIEELEVLKKETHLLEEQQKELESLLSKKQSGKNILH
jgi:hypothetical protein